MRGHVEGICCGDMLQRQVSSRDIPVFAKKFCCGDRIMTYGVINGAFLLVLEILYGDSLQEECTRCDIENWGHFVPAS